MTPVRVATVTCSDTRTEQDDEGGKLLGQLLSAAGFMVVAHRIEREDLEHLRMAVAKLARRNDVDAIVLTGGTGLAPRDVTAQAIEPLLDKHIPGFGEAFRRLSVEEIGPRGILSNAIAGLVQSCIVIALPGSPAGVRLGVEKLIAPTLRHAVDVATGRGHHK
ncbi:MAG TPA: MogA/MoaB family molybdenum cofactor biosynthesis protein [Polyangiaceae bacterium]|nr:MogA/MoaB family molybdenum cofactor biosynthesis protein [Polyangiaceae bacterium]